MLYHNPILVVLQNIALLKRSLTGRRRHVRLFVSVMLSPRASVLLAALCSPWILQARYEFVSYLTLHPRRENVPIFAQELFDCLRIVHDQLP